MDARFRLLRVLDSGFRLLRVLAGLQTGDFPNLLNKHSEIRSSRTQLAAVAGASAVVPLGVMHRWASNRAAASRGVVPTSPNPPILFNRIGKLRIGPEVTS
jgi:hypothetical protein